LIIIEEREKKDQVLSLNKLFVVFNCDEYLLFFTGIFERMKPKGVAGATIVSAGVFRKDCLYNYILAKREKTTI